MQLEGKLDADPDSEKMLISAAFQAARLAMCVSILLTSNFSTALTSSAFGR